MTDSADRPSPDGSYAPARDARRWGAAARPVTPTVFSLLRGLVVLRLALLVWMAGVLVLLRGRLRHPLAALAVVAAVAAFCALRTRDLRRPDRLNARSLALVELALTWTLFAVDGAAFRPGHVFVSEQALVASFHIVAVMAVGAAFGPWGGAGAGASIGIARWVGAAANGFHVHTWGHVSSLAATAVFSMLFGAVTGWVVVLLRRSEREVALARARDEVARTLHDGVLQVLALVDRRLRDSDPELAALARTTDRDLRAYLYGAPAKAPEGLRAALTDAVNTAAHRHDLRVELSVLEGEQEPSARVLRALSGAVGEALANVAKHAGAASRVVVFGDGDHELDGHPGVFVSVRDDGHGFDAGGLDGNVLDAGGLDGSVPRAAADGSPGGAGIAQSIRARLVEVGGRAEITSAPGAGTEVRLLLPLR